MTPRIWIVLALACCTACAPQAGGAPRRGSARPAPTEHRLDADAERRNNLERKAWVEEMHRTGPGIDWRAVERENGRVEQERRNSLGHDAVAGVAAHWTEVGSSNLAGRMHTAVIGPSGTKLYAGSALGGVWRGNLDGTDWEPLGDNLFGGAHELVVLPGENAGEPDVIVTITDGGLVHVSRDEGLTWEVPVGTAALWEVRGVAALQDVPRTILLYAYGPGTGFRFALLASIDYGRTFTVRWQTTTSWSGWMWVPRVGTGTATNVYIAHQGILRRSLDGGFTFGTGGTIAAGSDRAVLTGSEAGAPRLYAAARVSGQWKLYRSDNAGGSWVFKANVTDFWESLGASLINPDIVVYGGVEAFRSADGGGTFTKMSNWWEYYDDPANKLHADIPGIHTWPDPVLLNTERWYLSTDGGIFATASLAAGVDNISLDGLAVSQYYSTLSSTSNWNRVSAGAQDQGYQTGIVQHGAGSGPSTPLEQVISGDYGHLTSSAYAPALVYSTYPGFILIQDGPVAPPLYFADFPSGSSHSWLPPVVADPELPGTFYFCGERLYRYDRVTESEWSWSVHAPQLFGQPAVTGTYLSALAFAPSDPDRAYAANDAGRIFRSNDHGLTWTLAASSGPQQHYFYGTAIAVHPQNADEAAIGGSGYGPPAVVRSTDGGVSWQQEAAGLPPTLVYSLTYDLQGNLYAATEAGAYRWDRDSEIWHSIMGNEAPLTLYWSVELVNDGGTLRFGTYGRGIWDYAAVLGDRDADTVPDSNDLCPNEVDPDQADLDSDGYGDACDSCTLLVNEGQDDSDGDDAGDGCDCSPADAGAFSLPPEVAPLSWSSRTLLAWPSALTTSGSDTAHILFRGALGEFPVGSSSNCTEVVTQAAKLQDADLPLPGAGFWYLVRGSNLCGDGTLGTWGAGVERTTPTCAR